MTEWIKIDEQQAEGSWMGYEDFISADRKTIKRVWYDGFEEEGGGGVNNDCTGTNRYSPQF